VTDQFFAQPIVNSNREYPAGRRELDRKVRPQVNTESNRGETEAPMTPPTVDPLKEKESAKR
jgi:hypothetical protein